MEDESADSREPRNKRSAFVRLGERRTLAVLEKIRILSNLSNHHAYEFYEEDVDEIFDAIEEELSLARAKFTSTQRRKPDFSLSKRDRADRTPEG